MFRRAFGFVAAWAAVVAAVTSAASQDVFVGKSLAIIIGFGSGGGYDLWGRTLARHIGRAPAGTAHGRPAEPAGRGLA